jgi:hypothetical protein
LRTIVPECFVVVATKHCEKGGVASSVSRFAYRCCHFGHPEHVMEEGSEGPTYIREVQGQHIREVQGQQRVEKLICKLAMRMKEMVR